MIPISALITPYQPTEQSNPMALGNAIGGVGTFLEDRRSNQVAEELKRLQSDRNYELEKSATEGKNDYYASQAETAREKLGQDRSAKTETMASKLLDQLPEAHRKGDDQKVRAIYDRLKTMGYQVQEGDTSLPEDKPTAARSPSQSRKLAVPEYKVNPDGSMTDTAEGKTYAKGQYSIEADPDYPKDKYAVVDPSAMSRPTPKRPEPPPEFAGYESLGGVGASRSGQRSETSYATLGDDGEALPPPPAGMAPKPVPPEIAALNQEGPAPSSPSAGAAPMKRGGKFTVTDKDGNVIHEYDAPLEQKRTRDQIQAMAEPLVGRARNSEEEKAYAAAAESTAKLVGVLPPNELVKYFQDSVKTQLGEFKKSRMGGDAVGGPAGPSKTDLKVESMGNEETNRIIARVRATTHAEKAAEAEAAAQAGLASLDSAGQGGMQQLEALKQHMLALSGKVVTDREMGQFMGSTGVWNEIQAKLGKYTAGGEMPPEFLSQLRGVLMTGLQTARTRRNAAAQNAYQQTLLSTGDKRQAAIARGNFNDDFSLDEGVASAPKSAAPRGQAKAAASPAPAGDAHAAALARARKLLGQ